MCRTPQGSEINNMAVEKWRSRGLPIAMQWMITDLSQLTGRNNIITVSLKGTGGRDREKN